MRDIRYGGDFEKVDYWDKISVIEALEKQEMLPLIKDGKARLVSNSDGDSNPQFGNGINNSYYIRRYEIPLKTGLPFVTVRGVIIDFKFDKRTGRGGIQINGYHAWLLRLALDNEEGHDVRLATRVFMR